MLGCTQSILKTMKSRNPSQAFEHQALSNIRDFIVFIHCLNHLSVKGFEEALGNPR